MKRRRALLFSLLALDERRMGERAVAVAAEDARGRRKARVVRLGPRP
jgi:hypothetical protein